MTDEEVLDRAADIIARARTECLESGIDLKALADLFVDDAILALYSDGRDRKGIQAYFRDVAIRRVPGWFKLLPNAR